MLGWTGDRGGLAWQVPKFSPRLDILPEAQRGLWGELGAAAAVEKVDLDHLPELSDPDSDAARNRGLEP